MKEVVFDIETEKEFRDVGGKANMHLLGVSVVGVYEYDTNAYYAYEKEEFNALERVLENSSLLIGFNINHFDIPVLAPHLRINLHDLSVLDLMEDVERNLGFRVSLDNLCQTTLNIGKSGVGLEAVQWWREGKKDRVKEYCLQDVRLTRDLYEFGKREGFVICSTRDRGRVRIPVEWRRATPAPKKILENALRERMTVEIEYADDGKNPLKRRVDVHRVDKDAFEGFCHVRGARRLFQLNRVMSAVLTSDRYQLQDDVQRSLI